MALNGHIPPYMNNHVVNSGGGNPAPAPGSTHPNLEPRVARRTFGLFCLCDFLLIFLLWTILLSIKKKSSNFIHMFRVEIKNYSISTSMADVVLLSIIRDAMLTFGYLVLKCKHWMVAGFCAVCSSAFLLSKVFFYPMSSTGQPVTYFSILASFAMTWIATYMVDFKKLRSNHEFGSSNAVQPSVFFPPSTQGGVGAHHQQVAPDDYRGFGGQSRGSFVMRSAGGGGFDDSNSVYVTVNGSEVGEENRRVLPMLEENNELSAIEKTAEIESREAFEIGIRLKDLPAEEWKLEECGAYGTCVCIKQMPELGRVYKLEMIINLSPEQLENELTNYAFIPSWDKTIDSITVLHSFGECTKVLRLVTNEIEGRRSIAKREFVVSMRSATLENTFYSFGSSITYSPEDIAAREGLPETHDLNESDENALPCLTRGEYKILGFIIKRIENDCNKCEMIKFMSTDIKSWIAQFRVDKAITQSLLTYAECLQFRVKKLNENTSKEHKISKKEPAISNNQSKTTSKQNSSSA